MQVSVYRVRIEYYEYRMHHPQEHYVASDNTKEEIAHFAIGRANQEGTIKNVTTNKVGTLDMELADLIRLRDMQVFVKDVGERARVTKIAPTN